MVQRALVEPALSVAEVTALHVGLVQFLLREVNRISGIDATVGGARRGEGRSARAGGLHPGARVRLDAARRSSELTLGQVLLHLQMLDER